MKFEGKSYIILQGFVSDKNNLSWKEDSAKIASDSQRPNISSFGRVKCLQSLNDLILQKDSKIKHFVVW